MSSTLSITRRSRLRRALCRRLEARARAIENGQQQVTREQVDAALARADAADAKSAEARKG